MIIATKTVAKYIQSSYCKPKAKKIVDAKRKKNA